jgi:hypothetical protein
LLISMAIRSDHALGCPGYYDQGFMAKPGITHKMMLEGAINSMRQIYEEVAGYGFYKPEKEESYIEMAKAAGLDINI